MHNKKIFISIIALILMVGLLAGCSSDDGILNNVKKYNITTKVKDGEGGTISVSPDKDGYSKNEEVTLEAVPDVGYKIEKWSGDVDVTAEDKENIEVIKVVMDSDKTVIAEFKAKPYPLEVDYMPQKGEVIEEELIGSTSYDYGTTVKLTADPKAGYEFTKWSGDISEDKINSNPVEIAVEKARTINAEFTLKSDVIVAEGNGDFNVIYQEEEGEYFTILQAVTQNAGVFTGWTGLPDTILDFTGDSPSSSKRVAVQGLGENPAITANFEELNGAFTLVNSWGALWGPNENGKIDLTYAAAINNNLGCYVMAPRDDYKPQAIAVFDLDPNKFSEYNFRTNFEIVVEVYNSGAVKAQNPIASKKFMPDVFFEGAEAPFPENPLALDITEVLQEAQDAADDETSVDVVLNVTSTDSYEMIHLNTFKVELYENGYDVDPTISKEAAVTSGEEFVEIPGENKEIKTVISSVNISGIETPLGATKKLERIARSLRNSDIEKFTEKGSEENVVIDGHGTGLKPMTAEDWKQASKNDSIKVLERPLGGATLPESVDLTGEIGDNDEQYFPPIGDQGQEGSCSAWATTYYAQTFYEAKDIGWDFSGQTYETADKSYLMSPEFTYQLARAEGGGSSQLDLINIMEHIGTSSLATMPYDDTDDVSWGNEEAWREAPKYRSDGFVNYNGATAYYIYVDSIEDLNIIKSLINEGYIINTSVDANQYYVWQNGVPVAYNPYLTVENYQYPSLNHANTIASYDDTFTINSEQ